jgi:hypothetical protein
MGSKIGFKSGGVGLQCSAECQATLPVSINRNARQLSAKQRNIPGTADKRSMHHVPGFAAQPHVSNTCSLILVVSASPSVYAICISAVYRWTTPTLPVSLKHHAQQPSLLSTTHAEFSQFTVNRRHNYNARFLASPPILLTVGQNHWFSKSLQVIPYTQYEFLPFCSDISKRILTLFRGCVVDLR